ncbi:Panacea domain-containing protein [Roseateles sp. UC29_93]|uniref:Panacea domain-containing protein n=1 Tax=Roseateles sp. UC29_93 TaxID=3350177 RepID=UPI000312B1F3
MSISPQLDAIHRLIIECHRKYFDESPSPNKLQKLCYYAQGYSLAEGRALFPEDFEARQNGPTIAELHAKYGSLQWHPIDAQWHTPLEDAPGYQTVREVVAAFGRFDGAALSNMTHNEAPWLDARNGLPENMGSRELISKDAMRKYFLTQLPEDER